MKLPKDLLEPITPILIKFGRSFWTHPDEDYYDRNECSVVTIRSKENKKAELLIHSKELCEGKIPAEYLQMMVEVTLFEDTWAPGPCTRDNDSGQFCFSKFGKRLSESFGFDNLDIIQVSKCEQQV